MSTTLRVIEDATEFIALRPAWDDLETSVAGGSVFTSWPWLMAAWKTAENSSRPVVIVASEHGRLIAGAALQRRRVPYYGIPVSETCFLGDGLADRQVFLCLPGHSAAMDKLWQFLASNPWRCELLRLEQIPEDSLTLAAGRRATASLQVEPASVVSAMQIRGPWDNYFQSLQSELRRDLRQSERRLTEIGDWRICHLHGKEIEEFLPTLRTIEMTGYKSERGKAFFADARNEAFIRTYVEVAPSDSFALTLLEVNGQVAAYGLGFVHRHTYHGYNTSFDNEFRRAGPGKYVIAQSIKYAMERELDVMDFSRGGTHLKTRFGGKSTMNVRAVYFYPGAKGSILRLAVFVVRPWLKSGPWRRTGTNARQM